MRDYSLHEDILASYLQGFDLYKLRSDLNANAEDQFRGKYPSWIHIESTAYVRTTTSEMVV